MNGNVAMLGWCDLTGTVRVRAVPEDLLPESGDGLGWPAAGHAMLPLGAIAPNPWGPTEEVRHVPVDARAIVPADDVWPDFHLVLTRALDSQRRPWDCCPRAFCEAALAALKEATGWTLMSAFEFEFSQLGNAALLARPVYSLDAFRSASQYVSDAMAALRTAQLLPVTVEPETGAGQLELSTAVFQGLKGPDNAILTREVLREVSRRKRWPITFSPKVTPKAIGNGQHIHFSFLDGEGRPVLYDPSSPALITRTSAAFVAGVMNHMNAICAVAAPSPVSYLRLGPNHWSCGHSSFGVQNREVAVRVCPPVSNDAQARARTINLEFRPPDSLSNPYLVLGMLVYAGLDGITRQLPLPPVVKENPADLPPDRWKEYGIAPLPATLGEALDALEHDLTAQSWMPQTLYRTYLAVKRTEIALCEGKSAQEICDYYAAIY